MALSGAKIGEATSAYAVECDVKIPNASTWFKASNKRMALYENLMRFAPEQQYRIIKDLCAHPSLSETDSARIKDLKCSIPDDHIDPRRSAFFMARSVSGSIREDVQC